MSELVYRRPCEHGQYREHFPDWDKCPGGVEIVLDPERLLAIQSANPNRYMHFLVRDILDVLDKETP